MKLLYIAIAVLAAFLAVWILYVVPAERRHHERKLAALQRQIEKRTATQDEAQSSSNGDDRPGGD